MKKNLICINCPLGCNLEVEYTQQELISVEGNTCVRGVDYARNELFSPKRMITSTIAVKGSKVRIPVKTEVAVDKAKIMEVMKFIAMHNHTLPISRGDVIIHDVAQTGVDVIATKTIS